MFRKSFIAALAVAAALPAFAQDGKSAATKEQMVLASDPDSVVAFFEDLGMPARLTEDAVGDPLIEFRSAGDKLSLFFYDCEDNTDCQAVQFYSGYNAEGTVSLEMINDWNTDRRFVRAYLTEDDVARIEMDIATSFDGLTYRDFGALLDLWLDSMVRFEDHISW